MPIIHNNWKEQRHLRKKAEKVADQTHLTYCWLRADQAIVQLQQLKRSHELTPVCLPEDEKDFQTEMRIVFSIIDRLKYFIKKYQEHLKKQAGKK